MPDLVWSKTPPTQPGWYFWRTADNFRVFHVDWRGNSHRLGYGYEKGSACLLLIPQEGEEWAGPMPEPIEPKEAS